MYNIVLSICKCTNETSNLILGLELNDFITAAISVGTLLLNILFYIIIAPKISFRFQKKEDFLKYSSEFITFLSGVNSLTDFEGVPTKVKSYCVSIELLFKSGVAPEPLRADMENVFQAVKKRKSLTSEKEIEEWNSNFRTITQKLRKSLAKYTGTF